MTIESPPRLAIFRPTLKTCLSSHWNHRHKSSHVTPQPSNMAALPPVPTGQGVRTELEKALADLTQAVQVFTADDANREKPDEKAMRVKIMHSTAAIQGLVTDMAGEMLWTATKNASIRSAKLLFSNWGVFEAIPIEEGSSISYADLAAKVDAEEALLARLGSILVCAGVLTWIGPNIIAHTPSSRAFLSETYAKAGFLTCYDNVEHVSIFLPDYFAKYGRKESQTMNHVPVTFANGHPEKTYYDYVAMDQDRLRRFMLTMTALEETWPIGGVYDFSWVVEYVKNELGEAQVADGDRRVLFVDVGGAEGHAIRAIKREFPELPLDRFVLQDRQASIDRLGEDDALKEVEKMAIDFHVGQPVRGALVYWIRKCLHNYPDKMAINILTILAEAMASDSKLIIGEDILHDPPQADETYIDFIMLNVGGKQRNLMTWEKVISAAGLKISSISTAKGPLNISAIECVKVMPCLN